MTTIVMTGGTSGFGRVAATQLAAAGRLLLGSRAPVKDLPGAERLALDLARMESVRRFATDVTDRVGDGGIGALVLNAGLSLPDDQHRTVDGFETTFGVNHLAHYLLLRLLLPYLANDATVVITTSGTHDPAEGTVIPPPRHANARLLAHTELDPERDSTPRSAGGRAYAASKLCNVLTARALAAQPEATARQLTAIAYDPGPTPGTGLVRNNGAVLRFGWRRIGPMLQPLIPRFNSRKAAGVTLAELALGRSRPPAAQIYAALRQGTLHWRDPSELARHDGAMEALWSDSANLVGLPAAWPSRA